MNYTSGIWVYLSATRFALNHPYLFFLKTHVGSIWHLFGGKVLFGGFSPYPLINHLLGLLLDRRMLAFTFFYIYVMQVFLKLVWLAVCWQQHYKVIVFLLYKWFFLWRVFYHHILELFISAVKRSIIIWRIQFLECSYYMFVYFFMMILFNSIFCFGYETLLIVLCASSSPL